jgi:cobaltochelatase CobT
VSRHQKHGRLDKSSIVKLALPPIDGGEYNKKLFYEMEHSVFKDTAIFVLTDWSGSMNGRKMRSAADASQRLVWVMERILKIPVALATFSNGRSKCDVGYVKPYATRGLSAEEIAKRFAKFSAYTSANNDADALHWAWHELRKRHETRKILIVLSDGAPAGQWSGRGKDNLRWLAKQIDHDRHIELYGVGIHSNAVRNYYKNYKVLNGPEEINETLFNLIKQGDSHVRRTF